MKTITITQGICVYCRFQCFTSLIRCNELGYLSNLNLQAKEIQFPSGFLSDFGFPSTKKKHGDFFKASAA